MADPVRIGVVGVGALAQRGILPHLTQDDVAGEVRVEAVCDPAPGRAAAAAERFGVPKAYTDYAELLTDRDIDAVTIASPIGLHYEQGRQALEAGKHIHVNKTLTTTVAEATHLIELAKAKSLRIVASPGEVLRPHHAYIRTLIESGAIGTLCWATCGAAFGTYHENEPERSTGDTDVIDPSWYFRQPGGGPLYDMTVYSLHGLTSVLGPARRVTAMSATRINERVFRGRRVQCDAHDNTMMLLDFSDGLFALAYGTAAGAINRGFSADYFGTKGSIVGLELNGKPLEYPGHEIANSASGPDWLGRQWLLPHVTGPHRDIDEQHVFEDIMQLVDWIREDKPSPVTAEHARHVIDIIESAYRSAATGKTEELTTTFSLAA